MLALIFFRGVGIVGHSAQDELDEQHAANEAALKAKASTDISDEGNGLKHRRSADKDLDRVSFDAGSDEKRRS